MILLINLDDFFRSDLLSSYKLSLPPQALSFFRGVIDKSIIFPKFANTQFIST